VARAAQAGLLRDRQQCEKSQGFGDRVPELFPHQTKTETCGKSALAFSTNRRFTLNQYSTKDRLTAERLFNARNEAHQQPIINLQIARAYLLVGDPQVATRTWQFVMDEIVKLKHDETRVRWLVAIKDKALDGVRDLPLLESRPTAPSPQSRPCAPAIAGAFAAADAPSTFPRPTATGARSRDPPRPFVGPDVRLAASAQSPRSVLRHTTSTPPLCEKNAVEENPVSGVERPSEQTTEGKTPAISDVQASEVISGNLPVGYAWQAGTFPRWNLPKPAKRQGLRRHGRRR
jgi:hypothetical protein